MRIISQILIISAWLIWVISLSPLYLISWVPIFWKYNDLTEKNYDLHQTLCGILYKKGLLNQDDYDFEHNIVGENVSHFVFLGYLIQVWPVLRVMQISRIIDQPVLSMTERWISIQKIKYKKGNLNTFDFIIEKISVISAYLIGRSMTTLTVFCK